MSQSNDQDIKKYIKASQVKVDDIIVIKGRLCKVISVSVSKTGKHGHVKVHFKFIDGKECISAMQDIEIQS